MKSPHRFLLKSLLAVSLFAGAVASRAQGTAFTYQGLLDISNTPASGNYDFSFQLYNAAVATNTAAVGSPLSRTNIAVTNGLFTVSLDFGAAFNGSNFWVQISVATNGDTNLAALSSLLPINPTPYAIFAGTASNALTATTLSGTVANGNLSGTYTNTIVLSNAGNNFVGSFSGVFNGNGAALSNLQAGAVLGTVSNVSLSGAYNNALTFTNAGNKFAGSFTGDGTGLTNVTAPFFSGVLSNSGLSGLYTNMVTLSNASNVFIGNGSGLSGVIAASVATNFSISDSTPLELTNTANSYVGDGSGLSNLSAAVLSGTDTNLVTFSNAADSFYGSFTGNGAGLTNVPAAALNGVVTNVSLSGSYASAVTISNAGDVFYGVFSGSGSGLTNLSAADLTGGPWVNASVAGLSNTGAYSATNLATGAAASLSTNAHLTLLDETGTLYQTKTNGRLMVLMTNGNSFILSNGSLTISSNGDSLQYSQGNLSLSGNAVIVGNLSVSNVISGNGSGLTGLNASNIATGTVPVAQLPLATGAAFGAVKPDGTTIVVTNGVLSSLPVGGVQLNGTNTWTGTNKFTGVVSATNAANLFGGSFTGNGGGLTNVTAAALATNYVLTDASPQALTNTANVFVGNGAGLTALNASNFTTGIVPVAQLPVATSSSLGVVEPDGTTIVITNGVISSLGGGGGGVPLDGTNTWTGTNTFGSAIIATNDASANEFAGTFTGDGSGLSNVTATALSGTYANAVNLTNAGNTLAGNGAGLTALNASNLTGTVAVAQLPVATTSALGVVQPDGTTITISDGVISAATGVSLAGTNTWTGTNTFSGTVIATNGQSANQFAGAFIGDGSALSNVTAGVLSGTYANTVNLTNAGNTLAGNGAGLTALNASNLTTGTIPLSVENPAVITNADAAAVGVNSDFSIGGNATVTNNVAIGGTLGVTGLISGNGNGLTNIKSIALTGAIAYGNMSGLVGSASGTILSNTGSGLQWALPSVQSNFTNTWTATNTFNGTVVATNNSSANAFTGTLAGNGAGITNFGLPVMQFSGASFNFFAGGVFFLYGGGAYSNTVAFNGTNFGWVAPCPGKVLGLYFSGTLPGTGIYITNTVYTNGAASPMTCAIGNNTTQHNSDTTHTFSVATGEVVNLAVQPSANVGSVYYNSTLYFAPGAPLP